MNRCVNGQMRRHFKLAFALALGASALCGAGGPTTTMLNVSSEGELPACDVGVFCYSITPSISDDGRFVVFTSTVQNIVPGPHTSGAVGQLLLHDRHTCELVRLSQTSAGIPGNFPSTYPVISGDGSTVAFTFSGTNLVSAPGLNMGTAQVMVYHRLNNTMELISKSAGGVAGNGSCGAVTISEGGRYVCFQSDADNLIAGDTNGMPDIFVFDRQANVMRRVNVGPNGEQSTQPSRRPAISPNGRYVAFDSNTSNFSPISTGGFTQCYLVDRDTDNDGIMDEPRATSIAMVSLTNAGLAANGHAYWPVPTPDGSAVVFNTSATNLVTGDTNGANDIFMRTLGSSTTTRVSVGPGGAQANAGSWFPMRFSADGRYMTFHSAAQGLIADATNGMTHIYRRDLTTGTNIIVSRNSDGDFADSSSEYAAISGNGEVVVYGSAGNNMIPGGSTNPDWVNVYARSFERHPPSCERLVCLGDIVSSTFLPPPDGQVDGFDLAYLLGAWGANPGDPADLVSDTFMPPPDGFVDGFDLAVLLGAWGPCE
jgi:Tol biopolymer transport system component